MEQRTELTDILFPVVFKEIFYDDRGLGGRGSVHIPQSRALVNRKTGQTLGIVGKGYRLVTNEEALEFGKQAFRQLFSVVDLTDMEVFNVIAPQSGYYCHIDLVHKNYRIEAFKKETYWPYIRITNSYNRSKALRFDLGFLRGICTNGVIFEHAAIKFKFPHTKSLGCQIKFDIDSSKIKRLETEFTNYMTGLDKYLVPRSLAPPLMCKALGLQFKINVENEKRRRAEQDRLAEFKATADELIAKYYKDLGGNAYAVFDAVTEYASVPSKANGHAIGVNSLQTRTGKWIRDFAAAIQQSLQLEDYVSDAMPYFQNGKPDVGTTT